MTTAIASKPLRNPALPRVGHAGRLAMSPRERLLVLGHLCLIAIALEDDELVETLAEVFDWGARTQAIAETVISIGVLVLWGLLTMAWVRCRGSET